MAATTRTSSPESCVARSCTKVAEDEHTFAFNDINPARVHVLVIPKGPVDWRDFAATATPEKQAAFTRGCACCRLTGIAESGFRVVSNIADGHQEVLHLAADYSRRAGGAHGVRGCSRQHEVRKSNLRGCRRPTMDDPKIGSSRHAASIRTVAFRGIETVPVEVQVHVANGLPSVALWSCRRGGR